MDLNHLGVVALKDSDPQYRAWNSLISSAVLRQENEGRTFYLDIDDDFVQAVARQNEIDAATAVDAFSLACQAEMRIVGGSFSRYVGRALKWRGAEESPPYIGILAITVLAASRMGSEKFPEITSNNYYAHLNMLLGRSVGAEKPDGFEAMGLLFDDFADWLNAECSGRFGIGSFPTHDQFAYIGYALAQCALRASDRLRLPDFFRSAGLAPGDVVTDTRLLTLLRAWSGRQSSHISSRGARAIAGPDGDKRTQSIVSIAQRELAGWDGCLRDREGRRRSELRLFLETSRRRVSRLRVFAPCPEGFPARELWKRPSGDSVELVDSGSGWYGEVEYPNSPKLLAEGARLTCRGFALTVEPSGAVPFAHSYLPESGLISESRITLLRDYVILAPRHLRDPIERLLKHSASSGWTRSDLVSDVASGWDVYYGVRFTDAMAESSEEGLERLVPKLQTATHTTGGLKLARSIYLSGGEPDVEVTREVGDERGITLDGEVEQFDGPAFELRLRDRLLPAGEHRLEAGGRTISFSTVDTFGETEPTSAGNLAHRIEKHNEYRPASAIATDASLGELQAGIVEISGARIRGASGDLTETPSGLVVLRTGRKRCVLLGSEAGQLAEIDMPERPSWLHRGLGFQHFTVDAPFNVQAVVYESSDAVFSVNELIDGPRLEVNNFEISNLEAQAWAELVTLVEGHQPQVSAAVSGYWNQAIKSAALVYQDGVL